MSLLIVTWLKACIKVNLRGAQGGQKDVSLCHSLFLALVFNFDWHERISVHIPLNIATSPPSHHPMPMSWIRTRWIRVCLQPKSIKSSCVSLWVLNGTQDWGGPNDHRVPGPPLFEDSQTPTDIPAQARGRELISRVIWEEKIETPKKGLIVACTSTVLTYISCRCFLSLKTVWCCSSFQNSDRNVVEPENMASEKELQLNLCQQKLYIYCIRFVKGFIGRKIVNDTKIQTCEVISLQSGLFLCPEVKWFIRISPSPLLCLSSFYFPLVSNLIFCWNSLRQHMCTVCLQPRTHTSPIKILYYPCTHWEYTSLSISISFSLPFTWLCVSLSPDSQAFSLSLLNELMCTEDVLVYLAVLFCFFFLNFYFTSIFNS